jgi:4-amino-4-deoxy-L-arabinose transferase-like glycosyltransferase
VQQLFRHQLWILALGALVFLPNLGATQLWDQDEPVYATIAREMRDRGDWIVPTFNGQLNCEKPPMLFWLMRAGFALFGTTELAARFWSPLFALGAALLTYHLGRVLFRAEVGFWAGLIMWSNLMFTISARAATTDAFLVFLMTLMLLIFVLGSFGRGRWLSFAGLYLLVGVTVLTKGPVGLILPLACLGLFLAIVDRRRWGPPVECPAGQASREDGTASRPAGHPAQPAGGMPPSGRGRWLRAVAETLSPGNLCRSAWRLRPLTGLVIVVAVALPWYIAVERRTGGQWFSQFFGVHNLGRALRPLQNHGGPVFYYIPAILIGFFPWSLFLWPTATEMVRRVRRGADRTALVLLASWIGVFLVFWSLVSTKLPHYVLPIYPALALVTAIRIDGWLRPADAAGRRGICPALIGLAAVGAGLAVVVPVIAWYFLPGEGLLGLWGLILVAGGGGCLWLERRGDYRRMMAGFTLTSAAFLLAVFAFAALRVNRHQNARTLLAAIHDVHPGPVELASYRFVRESFIWQAGHPIPHLLSCDALRQFLAGHENACVLAFSDRQAEIEQDFGEVLEVVVRQPRFMHSGEVLVWVRRPGAPVPRMARSGEKGTGEK